MYTLLPSQRASCQKGEISLNTSELVKKLVVDVCVDQ
jgi:hypothetical protein